MKCSTMPVRKPDSLRTRLAPLVTRGGYLCLLGVALGGIPEALAHSDAYLDSLPSPHGGQVRMAGPLHLELVVQGAAVEVYVTDHAGAARSTRDAKALLRTTQDAAGIALRPTGENRFVGALPAPASAAAEFTLFVRLPGEDAQSANFSLPGKTPTSGASSGPESSPASEENAHGHHAH